MLLSSLCGCKTHKEQVYSALQYWRFFIYKRENGKGVCVLRDFDPLKAFGFQIMEQKMSESLEIFPSYKEQIGIPGWTESTQSMLLSTPN